MSDKKIILGIKAKNNIKMNVLPPSLSLTDVERAEKAAEIAVVQAAIAVEKASEASQSASNAAKSAQEAAQIAGSIGNTVVSVTATNGVITVEQSGGNRNTIDTIANATQATNDKNGNDISTTYLPNSSVGNAANKVPKYNNSGHLVFPDGSEMWVG